MEMFELGELKRKGGLKDQGETVDAQSQNQVPVGSLKKEVRDDVPINISEGEFVLPADVVRYHGLEKIMNMRQDAKSGLKLMDEMGQMGNSSEATLPDDIPFEPKKFQQGGINLTNPEVNKQNIVPGVITTQPGKLPTRPSVYSVKPPKVVTPSKPTYSAVGQPQYKPVTDSASTPSYSGLVGAPFGQLPKSETKKFINQETGEELYIPFVNGQPIYPIPAGFKQEELIKKEEEEKDPTKATVQTTRVTDSGDDGQQEPDTPEYKVASTLAKQEPNVITDVADKLFKAGPIGIALSKLTGRPDPQKDFGGLFPADADQLRAMSDKESQEMQLDSLAKQAGYIGGYDALAKEIGVEKPEFKFGNEKGQIDRTTGKFFDQYGQAGDATTGQVSYTSFDDFVKAMSASAKTGYYGSVAVAKSQPKNPKAQAFLKEMGETYKVEVTDPKKTDTEVKKDQKPDERFLSISDVGTPSPPSDSAGAVGSTGDLGGGQGIGGIDYSNIDDSNQPSGDDDDPGGVGGGGDSFGGLDMTAQGGFMSKKRVKKIKKMKRGGLASRK